jgi:hypothetical protein
MDTIRRVKLGVMLLLPACASTPPRTDDASTDVVDASTDVRVACPEGTCVYPGSDLCRLPAGPMSGCCACNAGVCSIECRCMAPDTPVATPTGDRRIDAIAAGDLVYGLLAGRITAVPVVEVRHTVAIGHQVQRITLVSGAVLEGSAGHPTADAKTFRDLRAGDWLGGLMVLAVETVPFAHDATWDILPASDGGAYFANGALIGSTLHARVREPVCPRVHALGESLAASA